MSDAKRVKFAAKRHNEQSKDILGLPGFIDDIKKLRIKWNIPKSGFRPPELAGSFRMELSNEDLIKLDQDIKELVDRYSIAPSWVGAVRAYLLIDQLSGGSIMPTVRHTFDNNNRVSDLNIKIEKDTTQEDVKAIWGLVESLQAKMPGRFDKAYKSPKPANRTRSNKVKSLRKNGKTYKQIADELDITYPEVTTILRNEKKRTKS